ncbi:cytochrome c oxidase assembly protein [Arthrobacter crystallopoietes]|uniref:Putative copper resistance protein D n=1 Tax=Crystallibacter crystallopoietes TaxID=37928 RepID=A0A1H0XK13_9MICC|nr:cytochrome c oxidase assembly protein [Arthrobacter crystallopoietes]SDQ03169.1 putative copper resistance protein D [Arthrobacter crystallopoietes]
MNSISTQTRPSPVMRLLPAIILAAAIALTAALFVTGIAAPRILSDPGTLVRWALPGVTAFHHLAMAATLGSLVLAVAVLPPDPPGRAQAPGARERALTVAAAAATVWTLAAASIIVLSYADIIGQPISAAPEFSQQLASYITEHALGRTWLIMTLIAAVTATLAFAVRSAAAVTATAVLAAAAVIPLSLIGHVAGSDDHNGAVNALALHLLGVCLWVGGVIALGLIAGNLKNNGPLARTVLTRFSALAGVAFALVVVSGIINTAYRIGGWEGLVSDYGSLVLFKTLATLVLGYIGWEHRRWIRAKAGSSAESHLVWMLIGVEAIVMGAVIGVSPVLGKTPPGPRVVEPAVTPAKVLTGYDLPPELGAMSWLTQWRWDWLWVAVALLLAAAYLAGIRRLRAAGTQWPLRRTLLWLAGLVLLVYATSGALAVYLPVLFGMHTAAHLLLIFAVPLLLTAARPYLLASKALPRRTDGTLGWREAMSLWPDSGPGRLLSRPAAAGVLTAVALAVFYYSPLFRWSLSDHVGHELMITASLVIGLVLAAAVLGTRPRSGDRAGVFTLLGLCALLVLWAVYTAALGQPVQGEWFASLGRTDAAGVLADFRSGAVAMLLAGTVPLLCAAAAIALRSGLTRRL